MKEKSVLISVRVGAELYKKVKKTAIDRDESVTSIVKRAFEKYVEEGNSRMTKEKLVQLIREERKNWDNEELEPAIVAILDREDGWAAAYKMIPEAWLDENREEVESYIDAYGGADSFDRWAVVLWLFEEFGEEYTTL